MLFNVFFLVIHVVFSSSFVDGVSMLFLLHSRFFLVFVSLRFSIGFLFFSQLTWNGASGNWPHQPSAISISFREKNEEARLMSLLPPDLVQKKITKQPFQKTGQFSQNLQGSMLDWSHIKSIEKKWRFFHVQESNLKEKSLSTRRNYQIVMFYPWDASNPWFL